jgi:ribosomal protein S8
MFRHKFAIENDRLTLTMNYFLEGPKNKGTVICKVYKVSYKGSRKNENISRVLNSL